MESIKRPIPPKPPIESESLPPEKPVIKKENNDVQPRNIQIEQKVETKQRNDGQVKPIIKVIDPVKRDKNRKIWLSILITLCLIGAIVCFAMLFI